MVTLELTFLKFKLFLFYKVDDADDIEKNVQNVLQKNKKKTSQK